MASAARAVGRGWSLTARGTARLRHWSLRGVAVLYLGLMIALPVAVVVDEGFARGLRDLRDALAYPGSAEAIWLTLATSTAAAVVNAVFGTLIAYVLVRFRFPGRRLLGAVVDLPLAIPTLVTGVMLVALYGPTSPVGRALEDAGIQVVFAQLGIMLALLVVTLPFVVRAVQPVLLELDPSEEEAAQTLGAGGWTTFRRIVLPAIRPAIAAGALLVFARSLGEFGSVVIISGNITGRTLTAPVLIFQLASQFKPEQAAAVATVLFAISFVVVLLTTRLVRRRKEETP
ncbi:MAG: sulfate ABC transporter permease subunit CysT [Candidatus Velamenicoccus archaeovorus]